MKSDAIPESDWQALGHMSLHEFATAQDDPRPDDLLDFLRICLNPIFNANTGRACIVFGMKMDFHGVHLQPIIGPVFLIGDHPVASDRDDRMSWLLRVVALLPKELLDTIGDRETVDSMLHLVCSAHLGHLWDDEAEAYDLTRWE